MTTPSQADPPANGYSTEWPKADVVRSAMLLTGSRCSAPDCSRVPVATALVVPNGDRVDTNGVVKLAVLGVKALRDATVLDVIEGNTPRVYPLCVAHAEWAAERNITVTLACNAIPLR